LPLYDGVNADNVGRNLQGRPYRLLLILRLLRYGNSLRPEPKAPGCEPSNKVALNAALHGTGAPGAAFPKTHPHDSLAFIHGSSSHAFSKTVQAFAHRTPKRVIFSCILSQKSA